MDYTLAPLPLEIADATRSPRRRRRHRKWKNGRFYIFLIFLWLRVVDVFILTCIYPKLPLVQKPVVIGWICVTATWSTVLLTAIWCRQKWATYVLAGSLIGAVIARPARRPASQERFPVHPGIHGRLFSRGVGLDCIPKNQQAHHAEP